MGDGAQQHFALGPEAQLGLRAGYVALFLVEIWPKEAKGGGLIEKKQRCVEGRPVL
jgi:hypothetical protein